mgnify:CR=1 FL=1
MLYSVLAVALGAACGALLRWGLGLSLNWLYPAIPPGTLAANLIGGYLIGIAITFFAAHPELPPQWRLLVITGFLGGLTTFSAFSAEITALIEQGRLVSAGAAATLHVGGSIAMTLLGIATWQLMRRV